MIETFVLIFWLNSGAGSAEFANSESCEFANARLEETYKDYYFGVCFPKGEQR